MYEVTRPVARTLPQARNGGDVRAHRAAVDSSRLLLSRVGSSRARPAPVVDAAPVAAAG
ncbi:Uncharacterised protein [Nocardia farcinica]|uniref:Uncharacterized protein n=1 Tax=Nocardia farcinica TaxID=37329 RepID=A0A449GGK3_NOCFR|nr:hypothetical protein [Nocardia farcinica]VFA91816.1 Uncharacterised protein [Nocardia farcinica]